MIFISLAREIRELVEYFIARIPVSIGNIFRNFYFKRRFSSEFKNNRFETGFRVEYPKNIKIRSDSFVGLDCKIYPSKTSYEKICANISFNSNLMINVRVIGKFIIVNNVLFGPNVFFRSNNHECLDFNIPFIDQGMTSGEIIIKDNVWKTLNCFILPNCTIVEGAIIAAGALFTNDIGPYSRVGGIPAKIIRKRNA